MEIRQEKLTRIYKQVVNIACFSYNYIQDKSVIFWAVRLILEFHFLFLSENATD